MNKNQKSDAQVAAANFNDDVETAVPLNVLPRTAELARSVAIAYLAVQGWTQAELKLDEYDQLVERVSLDIAGYALLDGLTPAHGRNVALKHWAWFADCVDAGAFCSVLKSCGYQVLNMLPIDTGSEHLVHFAHMDRCHFEGLCERTIFLTRQALSSGGFYDGWHTQYEGVSIAACAHGFHRLLDGGR